MFGFEFDFDFDIDLEHFQAHTQALAPSAMPGPKAKRVTIKSILINLGIIGLLIGSIFLYTGIFGARNAVSAISLVTALLMFIKTDIGIKTSHAPIVILVMFLFTGAASHVGAMNPYIGIPVNFAAIFLIVTFCCQSVTSKVYLPFVVCYIFSQGNEVYGMDFLQRMIGLAAGSLVVGGVYLFCHRYTKNSRGITSLIREIHLTSMRTRFAFRLAFSLTLGMFIGDLFDLPRTAWIGMTINSLILPFLSETKARFPYRVLAQFVGSAIFFLVFELFLPGQWYIIGLFLTSFIYLFFTDYRIQQIFVSINALVGATAFTDTAGSIVMRIELVFLGAAIVVLTNVIAIYVNPVTILKKIWERRRISHTVHVQHHFPEHHHGEGHHQNYHYHHKKQKV